MHRIKNIVGWIFQVVLSISFVPPAYEKLSSSEGIIRGFQRWGLPDNFYLVVGAAELCIIIFSLFPKYAAYASTLAITILIGVLITLTANGRTDILFTPSIVLSLAVITLCLRWTDRFRVQSFLKM